MVERPDVRFYRDVLFFFLQEELDKDVVVSRLPEEDHLDV